jgi:hypothetical protein
MRSAQGRCDCPPFANAYNVDLGPSCDRMISELSDMLLLMIALALLFDSSNGRQDSGNATATVVSPRILPSFIAMIIAVVLSVAGVFMPTAVAEMVGAETVDPAPATTPTPPPISPSSTETDVVSYYVAPNGSDSNPGTDASPLRTITAAVQRMKAGETTVVKDGVYEESSIRFSTSGTADKPITLKAQNKWGAVLSSISGDNPSISVNASNIVIDGLRLSVSPNNTIHWSGAQNTANAAIRAWELTTPKLGGAMSTGYQGLVVRNVLVDYSPEHSVGIKTNQDYSLVENCEIHSGLEAFNSTGTIFRNNTIYGADWWGSSLFGKGGVHNLQIYGNTLHMTFTPWGRGLYLGGNSGNQWVYDPSTGYEAYDSIAYNNTIINETGDPNTEVLGLVGTMNSTLKDNVIINGGTIFQAKGGPYQGTPAPMPVNSTITGNTLA